VPTVREPDGLAMSSRNRYLSPGDRARAPTLWCVLTATAARLAEGAQAATGAARTALTEAGFAVDYVALVDGPSLAPIDAPRPGARLIAAARLGGVRLIDNIAAGG